MKEAIELDDICASPHKDPYEAFFQLDGLREGSSFDPSVGLYGLLSSNFPIRVSVSEDMSLPVWIFPVRAWRKKKPSEKEVEEEVRAGLGSDRPLYAFNDIILPGEGALLVKTGEEITRQAIDRISEHNKKSLEEESLKPIKKVTILRTRDDEEAKVVDGLLQRHDFHPGKLRREKVFEIVLEGFEIKLPFPEDVFQDAKARLRALEGWERSSRTKKATLSMNIRFRLRLEERVTIRYEDNSYPLPSKRLSRWATLGDFPLFTERGTFIVNGLERVPVARLRFRPGLYLEREGGLDEMGDGSLSALVRPLDGFFLKIVFAAEGRGEHGASILAGTRQYGLEPFLRDMGVFEEVESMVRKAGAHWPESSDERGVSSAYWRNRLGSHFFKGEGYDLGPEGRRSLNSKLGDIYHRIGAAVPGGRHLHAEDLAAIIVWLQGAMEHGLEADCPMDLSNQRVWLLSEHLHESLKPLMRAIRERIELFLEAGNDISELPLNFSKLIGRETLKLFHGEACEVNDDTNPLAEISLRRKITLLRPGEGRGHHVSMERRGVHHSHYGRMCLTETPESENIGLNLTLALGAKIENGLILAPYVSRDGKSATRWLSVGEEKSEIIMAAGQEHFLEHGGEVLARKEGGVIERVDLPQVSLEDKYRAQFLGLAANLIPFVQHDDNNRVMMGAKNMKQAVPLLHPEIPLIKTGREDLVARLSGRALYARNAGRVQSVSGEEIIVETDEGRQDIYQLRPIQPTFTQTLTWHRVLVKRGDRVEHGQVLADGAGMRNGELALGVNLLVAYMPYHGLNFEDAVVISDRLVKEDVLTSLHVRELAFDVYGHERMSSSETTKNMVPFSVFKGVFCREGGEVRKGDRLFAKYRSSTHGVDVEYFTSPANGTVISIHKEPLNPLSQSPNTIRYRMICHLLEERKVSVGDKIMGRHGNKGVVSRILPQEQMPHLEDGTAVDIILNPHGVISRMNLGQLLETHWGWVLKHGGSGYAPYGTVAPFEKVEEEKLRKALRHLRDTGMDESGKVELIDGMSGERIRNRVVVGWQYFMKLDHMVEDKINVRETAAYTLITRQPVKGRRWTGGQRVGEMEVWALHSHLAGRLLQEFMTLKSDTPILRRKDLTRNYLEQESPLEGEGPFPESFRAAAYHLRGLCLDMSLYDSKGELIPLDSDRLRDLSRVCIRLADPDTIKGWAADKVVSNPQRPHIKRGEMKHPARSVTDPLMFQDKRRDMACIELAEPVIHPLYLKKFKDRLRAHELFKGKAIRPGAIQRVLEFKAALVSGEVVERERFLSIPRFTPLEAGAGVVMDLIGDNLQAPLEQAILTRIPVIPLDYRPEWLLHGGVRIKCGLNDFYRDILEADARLREALECSRKVPGKTLFRLRARLQGAVNRLMVGDEQPQRSKQRSLGDRIKGEEGILRMHLLGKRVDVSARSVIVPRPELELEQVGLPLEMAVGIVLSKLLEVISNKCEGEAERQRLGRARQIVQGLEEPFHREMIRKALFEGRDGMLRDSVVVLTRAPSLHKYNMLSFRPVCVEDRAIGLHPLVCGFFNADFDGDEMGVFLPLSREAMGEARERLSPVRNMLSAANGRLMLHLVQDIVLGIWVLTSTQEGREEFRGWFDNLIAPVKEPVSGKELVNLLHKYFMAVKDASMVSSVAQRLMKEGFRQATLSGVSFSIFDVPYISMEERRKIGSRVSSASECMARLKEILAEQCRVRNQ